MSGRFAVLGSLALGFAWGCGADDSGGLGPLSYPRLPGCEQIDPAPCDTLKADCQQVRLELAACLRGSEAGELPPVTLLTEAEYAAALNASFTARAVPDHFERAFSLLRLVEPGAFAPAVAVMMEVAWIWGFYESDTREITIIDHGQPADDARSNALLLHELVHALQDRDVDLAAFHEEHGVTFDANLASRSIIEGEADLHENHYSASLLGIDQALVDWPGYFASRIARGDQWVMEQASPLVASWSKFPYDYGQRFVDFAWQAGGHEALLGLFRAPPASTRELMASVEAPSPPLSTIELLAPIAPQGFSLPGNEQLGAWGLLLALTRVAKADDVRSLALTWRGDLFSVYAGPSTPPETALVWQLELADEASAGIVAAHLRVLLASGQVRQQGSRVVAAAASSGVAPSWAFELP